MTTNNQMNNYEYNEGIEFNGLMPKVMEADGIETIGASNFNAKLFENGHLGCNPLEVVDFFGTAFGENGGGEDDKHEYVDLGLPSGTLWATENIKDSDGNELYFAWGETQGYTAEQVGNEEGKRAFSWNDYKFGNYNELTKYNETDGLTVLEPEDDAATVNLGEGWRMPTKEEFEELLANTEYEWMDVDGVQGAKFTSEVDGYTDKFLFFPAVGFVERVNFIRNIAIYLTSSLLTDNNKGAYILRSTYADSYNLTTYNRSTGVTVRPVRN